jgi:hypothetical protein
MIIMLMTCGKNLPKAQKSKELWLNKTGMPYVILIGGGADMVTDYEFDKTTLVLKVKCPDDYENLVRKVHLGVCAVDDIFAPKDGILKADDDILVRVNELKRFDVSKGDVAYAGDVAKRVDHWSDWHFGKCASEHWNKTPMYVPNIKYCRGPIYYLGRKSIECLKANMNVDEHIYEDVLVGMTLNRNEIFPVQQPFMTDFLDDFVKSPTVIALHEANGANHDYAEIASKYKVNTTSHISAIILSVGFLLACAILVLFVTQRKWKK